MNDNTKNIYSFIGLMDQVESSLKYPTEIPRGLGLELRKRIDADRFVAARIESDLIAAGPNRLIEEELTIL